MNKNGRALQVHEYTDALVTMEKDQIYSKLTVNIIMAGTGEGKLGCCSPTL